MLMIYFVKFRYLNDHLFGRGLFIRFKVSAFRKLLSVCVFGYFLFGFEDRMWDLIVLVPDHCLSFCYCRSTILSVLLYDLVTVLYEVHWLPYDVYWCPSDLTA